MEDLIFSTSPKFQGWKREDYIREGIKYIVPMTAKAIEDEETQTLLLNNPNYIVEEKFDGTRGILQFYSDHTRCFSRRESKKSGWLTENTDSLPQLRDISITSLDGTVIDGEMFIPNRPFKDVAAVMNCTYDKAIERQKELGWVTFHAFDILYYKGVRTERMPLFKRKEYLKKVISTINCSYNNPFIREVPFYQKKVPVKLSKYTVDKLTAEQSLYPTLYTEIVKNCAKTSIDAYTYLISHRAYYEYVVFNGGEGVMVKPLDGRYYHKRSREYQKIKKFLTRECLICGFIPPTKEYTGKFPDDHWEYWVDSSGRKLNANMYGSTSAKAMLDAGYIPVTKYYYEGWVGNIEYGVVITDEDIDCLPKNKSYDIRSLNFCGEEHKVIIVGECSGFDEEERAWFTLHQNELVGGVIEIMANEIFRDTGKLRHPRFLRMRSDKSPLQCTWTDHIGGAL